MSSHYPVSAGTFELRHTLIDVPPGTETGQAGEPVRIELPGGATVLGVAFDHYGWHVLTVMGVEPDPPADGPPAAAVPPSAVPTAAGGGPL